jgi:hypothetical protein
LVPFGPRAVEDGLVVEAVCEDDAWAVAIVTLVLGGEGGGLFGPGGGEIGIGPEDGAGGLGVAGGAPAEGVELDEAVLPNDRIREGFGIEGGGEVAVFAELDGDAFGDFDFVVAKGLALDGAPIDVVPATVFVVVFIVEAPVAVDTGVEAGEGGEDAGKGFLGHVVIGLALVEIVDAGFVDEFAGVGAIFARAGGIDVGMGIGMGDIEGGVFAGGEGGEREEEE